MHVPVSHRFGETGSSPLKRILRIERRDDALRLTDIEEMSAECFFEQLRAGTYQESCPLGVLELSTFLKLTSI